MVAPPAAGDGTEEREARRRELKACMAVEAVKDVEALRTAVEAAKEVSVEREDLLPAEVLLRKLEGQFQPLTFSDVPRADMERLQAAGSRELVVSILLSCFHVQLQSSFLAEVIAEFHYHNFIFCQRGSLCAEKASTVLSIMNLIMVRSMAERLAVGEARALLDQLVTRHSRQLPPFSVGVFSEQEAAAVREYAERTLLRHYSMYLFVHSRENHLSVCTVRQQVANQLIEPTELLAAHEVDPKDVAELQDIFRDTAAEAAARAAADAEARRLAEEAAAAAEGAPPGDTREEQVTAAIDEAMSAHLGDFEARLAAAGVGQ